MAPWNTFIDLGMPQKKGKPYTTKTHKESSQLQDVDIL